MDEERGKESQRWLERQRESLRESARYELETSPAGRRRKEEVFLRTYVRDEEKADKRQNRERSE
jgi:hypothetical protein